MVAVSLKKKKKSYKQKTNLEELADRMGVHPSTISRWTCAVKDGGDEPPGRNPSLYHAVQFSKMVPGGIEQIFNPQPPEQRKATAGSGGGRGEIYRK